MTFGQVWEYAGIIVMVIGMRNRPDGEVWELVCLNDPPGGNLFLGEQIVSGSVFWTPRAAFNWTLLDA